ncbi:hypothetical protein [Marinococcus halophilus]|uniref:hypothetical protein n=1 Tax=Marinococcus halophilus TaxID=1371 RepID=UPI0015C42ABF|nr:hypothetical protein [Marinococcus halophilus]
MSQNFRKLPYPRNSFDQYRVSVVGAKINMTKMEVEFTKEQWHEYVSINHERMAQK